MPFFRTPTGLRLTIVAWALLLVVNVVTWAIGPADALTRTVLAVPEVLGILVSAMQLHRVTRAADEAPKGVQARASAR